MPKQAPPLDKDKPWFGKRCLKCEMPINYAYKSPINQWCGQCTDAVRDIFIKEYERRRRAEAPGEIVLAVKGREGRRPGWLLLALGLGLGALLTLGTGVALPKQAHASLDFIRSKLGL